MAIKFALKMKNDVEVRSLTELKENFDTKKIVGYFIDGKLSKWLEARYYEDELERVQELKKDDRELAKKLCIIFEVEYYDDCFDANEIEWKNKRIQMVKQITDDKEVIQNIEKVAFNQEELSDLYDNDVQTIYLLKGEFSIPKSKCNLTYKEYGNPKVIWPKEKNKVDNYKKFLDNKSSKLEYEMPKEIADKINGKKYAISDDYISYIDGIASFRELKIISKTGVYIRKIDIPISVYMLDCDGICAVEKNKLIIDMAENGLLLYDIEKDNQLNIGLENHYNFSVCNNKIIYFDDNGTYSERNLKIYDLESRKNLTIAKINGSCDFTSDGEFIYYVANNKVFKYSIEYGKSEVIYELKEISNDYQTICFNNMLYIYYEKVDFSLKHNCNLIGLNLNDLQNGEIEIFKFTSIELVCMKSTDKYFVYNSSQSGYPIYVFDVQNNSLKKIAAECGYTESIDYWIKSSDYVPRLNDFNVVEDYVYYAKGKNEEKFRVNIISGIEEKIN